MLYREKDLINWSPSLQSAISDIEVELVELTGKTELEVPGYKKKVTFGQLIKIAYRIKDSGIEMHFIFLYFNLSLIIIIFVIL